MSKEVIMCILLEQTRVCVCVCVCVLANMEGDELMILIVQ